MRARFTEDLDVLVDRVTLEQILQNLEGRGYVKPFEKSKNLRDAVHGVRIDFRISGQFTGDGTPSPVSFPDSRGSTVEIDGMRFNSLEKLIELKFALGMVPHRLGDLNDVQRIIQAKNLPESFAETLDPSVRDSFRERWKAAQLAANDEH